MNNSESINDQSSVEDWIGRQTVKSHPIYISIVVPAFNEERRLPPTLIDMIDFFDSRGASYEIIVVNDGSWDATSSVVKKFERVRNMVRIIDLPQNYGKGYAVKFGVLNSRGSRVLIADADGATPISEIERLERALDEHADIAIGSRAIASEETKVSTSIHRRLFGRVFNFAANFLLVPGIKDTQCGFKLFTHDVAHFLFQRQHAHGFSFDIEILHIARKTGLKIAEVPINWTNIPGSKVNLVLDPIRMLADIFRFKFTHRSLSPETYDQHRKAELHSHS